MFHTYPPACEMERHAEERTEKIVAFPKGQGKNILLVEDNERIRTLGQQILEQMGYRVITAADGQEALEAFRSAARTDLVITDLLMPKIGGRSLMQELRKANPGNKALAMAGHVMEE